MFLQGDKPNPTLTRDRASRTLFDSDYEGAMPTDTYVNFAFDHNTAEFDQLVESKYSHTFTAPAVAPAFEAPATEAPFNKYFNDDTSYAAPSDSLQKYYNDANPIPQEYKSFKPKVLTDFEAYEAGQKSEVDEALLQKIDEVQIYEPTEALERVEFAEDVGRAVTTESYLKLNAKGIIACVTFMAVTLLIIALIAVNSIAISGGQNRIRDLRVENTRLQQDYDIYNRQRAEALAESEAYINEFVNDPTHSRPPTVESLPPISSQRLVPANPDASNGIFNRIGRFLGSIFG